MKRQHLTQLLQSYCPFDEEEAQSKIKMLSFIEANENCFERFLAIGHITASSWLLNQGGSKALLTHHAKLGRWLQLGGHCDGNPNALEVAVREAQEESGLTSIRPVISSIFDIDVHLIPESSKEKAHFHYDVRFLLQVEGDEEVRKNHESKELLWVGKDRSSLPTNERSVTRMFDKWLSHVF